MVIRRAKPRSKARHDKFAIDSEENTNVTAFQDLCIVYTIYSLEPHLNPVKIPFFTDIQIKISFLKA